MINKKEKSKDLIKYFRYLYTSETTQVGNTTVEISSGFDVTEELELYKCFFVQVGTYANFKNIKIDGKFEKFMTDILITEDLYNSFKSWNMMNTLDNELETKTTTRKRVKL